VGFRWGDLQGGLRVLAWGVMSPAAGETASVKMVACVQGRGRRWCFEGCVVEPGCALGLGVEG
jgi:hypothetical protein